MVRKKSSKKKASKRVYGEEFYSQIGRLGGHRRSSKKAKKEDNNEWGEIFFPNIDKEKK